MVRTAHLVQTPFTDYRILPVRLLRLFSCVSSFYGGRETRSSKTNTTSRAQPCPCSQHPLYCNTTRPTGLRRGSLVKSRSRVKRITAHIALILLAFTLLVPGLVVGQTQIPRGPNRKPLRAASPETIAIERDFDEALKMVQEQYVDGKKINYNDVYKSTIIGMLRSLDPHSNYYDREEFEELKTDQRSEYFGIGASIQNYIRGDQADTYITATFDGSPAAKAGLRYGDRIVEVDGLKMTGKSSLEVRDKIRGPRGSTVKILLERSADKRMEKVE